MTPSTPDFSQPPSAPQLDRYFAGESDAAERGAVSAWLAARPDERARWTAIVDGLARSGWQPLASAAIHARARQIAGQDTSAFTSVSRPAKMRRMPGAAGLQARSGTRRGLVVAALSVAGLVVVAGLAQYGLTRPSAERATHTYATAAGERRTVTLDDGSTVALGPATTVRASGRTIDVEGTAYFTVVDDPRTPFLVRAHGAEVRVLGTRFGVQAYPRARSVRVVVTDGKVALRSASASARDAGAVLTRGTMAEWTDAGTKVWPAVDTARALAWRDARLVFDDTPLSDVVIQLEQWYGVRVALADSSLATQRVTASLRVGTLSEVLDLLAAPIAVRVERRDGQLVLVRR